MSAVANPYLEGLYAPVNDERHAVPCRVSGRLPPRLNGVFVQSNPNPAFEPDGPYHWFDGDGMLHGVHIAHGKATYTNRWLLTDKLAADRAAGRATTKGILCPFEPGDLGPDPDTANTHCVTHNGELLALWWLGGTPLSVDAASLQTKGPVDLGGGVAAHAKVDPATGELIFLDYSPYRHPYLHVGFASADRREVRRVPIDLPGPRLLHDLAITEQFVVVLDFPMQWDPERLALGKRRVTFDPDTPARLGLLPRHGSDEVTWFEAAPCYAYHVVNAWEEPGEDGPVVVVVACRIDNPMPGRAPEAHVPHLAFLRLEPYLHVWRLHTATGRVEEEQLDDVPTEFPRTDDRLLGRPSRFSYHPRVAREPTLLFDGVLRYDLQGDSTQSWGWGANRFGGETVFAPDPAHTDEARGYVMTFVSDRREGTTELVVLDARRVSDGPVARVHLPRRVPFGFHSHFMGLSQ